MSNVWFTGCPHFGHKSIIHFRTENGKRINSVEEHDELVYNGISSYLGKRDELFLLGDVCFSINSLHYVQMLREQCAGVTIVAGNHDFENSSRPTAYMYLDIGCDIKGLVKYKEFWLSHAPIHPDELRGKVNIHGHVHECTVPDSRYVNTDIGLNNFNPLSLHQIRTLLKQRKEF